MAKNPVKVKPVPPMVDKAMAKKGILRKKKRLLPDNQDN